MFVKLKLAFADCWSCWAHRGLRTKSGRLNSHA